MKQGLRTKPNISSPTLIDSQSHRSNLRAERVSISRFCLIDAVSDKEANGAHARNLAKQASRLRRSFSKPGNRRAERSYKKTLGSWLRVIDCHQHWHSQFPVSIPISEHISISLHHPSLPTSQHKRQHSSTSHNNCRKTETPNKLNLISNMSSTGPAGGLLPKPHHHPVHHEPHVAHSNRPSSSSSNHSTASSKSSKLHGSITSLKGSTEVCPLPPPPPSRVPPPEMKHTR